MTAITTAGAPSGDATPRSPSALDDTAAGRARDGRDARWEAHRAARREELVRAVRRAVHRAGPDVSMDDIAQAAGTSKPVLYRYFSDRTGLQMAVGHKVIDDMRAALQQAATGATTTPQGVTAMVTIYFEMVASSPNVYYFITRPATDAGAAPLTSFLDQLTQLVAEPFTEVIHSAASDAAAWAAGAVGFVRGIGEWWLTHRGEPGIPDLEELTAQVAQWLLTGPPSKEQP